MADTSTGTQGLIISSVLNPGLVLDVWDGRGKRGTWLGVYPSKQQANQIMMVQPAAPCMRDLADVWTISPRHAPDQSVSYTGEIVNLQPSALQPKQQWCFERVGTPDHPRDDSRKTYRIRNDDSGKCLTIPGNRASRWSTWTGVTVADWDGSSGQLWTVQEVVGEEVRPPVRSHAWSFKSVHRLTHARWLEACKVQRREAAEANLAARVRSRRCKEEADRLRLRHKAARYAAAVLAAHSEKKDQRRMAHTQLPVHGQGQAQSKGGRSPYDTPLSLVFTPDRETAQTAELCRQRPSPSPGSRAEGERRTGSKLADANSGLARTMTV